MADKLTKSNYFPESVVTDIFTKVRGKSTVAMLAQQIPVAFNGNRIFTFSMDGEIAIVGEGSSKPAGNLKAEPVSITPVKVIYQGRVSDEFIYAANEVKLQYLSAWLDGAAKKFARGLDLMAFHGINPATGELSPLITSSLKDIQSVTITAGNEDTGLEDALALLGDYENTGYAFSRAMGTALGKIRLQGGDGSYVYPEFRFGGKPQSFNGLPVDVNSTVPEMAIVGDWSAFRWGYAKEISFETIEYGNPDGLGDLKNTNEVLLRAEAYIGFAVIDSAAFAMVKEADGLAYDKNGGTGTMASTAGTMGQKVTVAENSFTAPNGKSFSKWNTKADGSGKDYAPNSKYTLTEGEDVLYAIWA